MCIRIILNLNNNNKSIVNIYENEKIFIFKQRLIDQLNIQQDFSLLHNGIELNNNKTANECQLFNDSEIRLIYHKGYIYLKWHDKIERINIMLDDTNNFKEKLIDLKNYLDKLYCCDYILEFNNTILTKEFDGLTLNQLGMQFNSQPNNSNTIHITK